MKHYIICAAVKVEDKIFLGKHHGDIIQNMHKGQVCPKVTQSMQGFIDNFGQFHTRREAAKIAFAAGQIKMLEDDDILISEDIGQRLWQINELN